MKPRHNLRTDLKKSLVLLFSITLGVAFIAGCGSSSDSAPVAKVDTPVNGEIDGTGTDLTPIRFDGTAAIGAALAGQTVKVKALSGLSITTTTNSQGDFSTPFLENEPRANQRAYLLNVTKPQGGTLFSVAYRSQATPLNNDNVHVAINIHPFTDLMLRHWFAKEGLDIDAAITGNTAITRLPTAEEMIALGDAFLALLETALYSNQVPSQQISDGIDLWQAPFRIGDAFDQFLDNTQVVINEGRVTVTAYPANDTMLEPVIIINNIALNIDIFAANDAPTAVSELRAMPTNDGFVNLAWSPASDDTGIQGYRILRNGQYLATSLFPVFTDTSALDNSFYQYTVISIDASGQLSTEVTINITVNISTPDQTPPPAPSAPTLVNSPTPVFNWTINDITDVARFEIWRGTSANAIDLQIGETTATQFTDDDAPQGVVLYYVIIAVDASGNPSAQSQPVVFNPDNTNPIPDTLPSIIEFTQTTYTVNESQRNVAITVERRGDASEAVSAQYATAAQSATELNDYTPQTGTLAWAAGDNSPRTINIALISNPESEPNEIFTVNLSAPSSNTQLGAMQVTNITIEDAATDNCITVEENITRDTLWDAPCYNVKTYLDITNEATLTIAPGTLIIFDADYSLSANDDGQLIANGTEAAPIVFTGSNASAGFWYGIEIRSNAISELSHVLIEYAGQENNFDDGALDIHGAANLDHITLRQGNVYGLSATPEANITKLANLTISQFANFPILIPADDAGLLSGSINLTQNETLLGEDKNAIRIANSTDLNRAQTWFDHGVPYVMPRVSFDVNNLLTLQAGVTLQFLPSAKLYVTTNGQLQSLGTAEDPVIFTGTTKIRGSWDGIQFTNSNNDNIIDHTIVEYAGGDSGNTTGAIGIFSSGKLTLSNSEIRLNNNFGFEFYHGAEVIFSNNFIHGNTAPGTLSVNDVMLLDNQSTYTGNDTDQIYLSSSNTWTISRDISLNNLGLPYRWDQGVPTSINHQLTINEGVEVNFTAGSGINIDDDGAFTINGTAQAPVILTSLQALAGSWDGIQINSNSVANNFSHAIIEYAGDSDGFAEAAIRCGHESQLTLDDTAINHSQYYGIVYSTRSGSETDITIGANVIFDSNLADNIFTYDSITF